MAEPQRTEKSIFLAALEIDSETERAAYLEQACAGNAQLRDQVEALMWAHDKHQPILDLPPPSAPTLAEDNVETPGTFIGPYKLVEQIGEGGMGAVWMAQQTEPVKRLVAVKLIKAGMDSRQVIARFEAERQALALMDHPNIAKVFDGGSTEAAASGQWPVPGEETQDSKAPATRHWPLATGGRPYFVMELVRGVPITKYCDERRLTLRQRLELFVPVCEAVQHAHQKGIIHRDLKPSNVLVALYDGKPVPKIIDFGVAKATGQQLTEQTLITGFGAIVGTLEYMSPEQAEFNQLDIDTRSDIYALGVLLYELLTGSPPFARKQLHAAGVVEMLRLIREQEPSKPSTKLSTGEGLASLAAKRGTEPAKLAKLVRGELDWIVMKALDKDRGRRYQTANGLALDLQRYLADEPVAACPPSVGYRMRKFAVRNKTMVAAAGLLAACLMMGAAVSTWLAIRATQAERLAQKRLGDVDTAGKLAAGERDHAQRRLYEARVAYAQASRWSGRAGRRFDGLKALAEAAQLARDLHLGRDEILKLRNEAIACLALVDLRVDQKWSGYPPGSSLTGLGFDQDCERYARIDEHGHITVRRLADNEEVVRISDIGAPGASERKPDWRTCLRFSPDGRFLCVAGDSRFRTPMQLWDLRGPKRVFTRAPADGFETTVDFSPDSRALAARGPDHTSILIHDCADGSELQRLSLGRRVYFVCFHPKGDRLAIGAGAEVHVLDRTGQHVLPPLGHPNSTGAASWSPDGQLLGVGCADGQAYIWDAATGKQLASLKGHQGPVLSVTFTRRGGLVATTAEDETTRVWDVRSGQEMLRTSGLASSFGGDDQWLGLGVYGHEVGRWQVAANGEHRILHTVDGHVYGLDVCPRGRLLAVTSTAGVRLWDLEAGTPLGVLPTGPSYSALFDRAGRFLIVSSRSGLWRWPIGVTASESRMAIGPPERIDFPSGPATDWAQLSANGTRVVAQRTNGGGCVVVDLDGLAAPRVLVPTSQVGISPDGKWVASTVNDGYQGTLWDAQAGKRIMDFPGLRTAQAWFSPDNRWLVFAAAAEYRFFNVGSWEPGPRVVRDYAGYYGGPIAFTRDGAMAAIAHSARTVKLIECRTAEEIATLAAPFPEELRALCFSADGSRLLAGTSKGITQLWDLRRIRAQLRDMGLDWEPPQSAGQTPAGQVGATPLKVNIDSGCLSARERLTVLQTFFPLSAEIRCQRGLAHAYFNETAQALADFDMAIRLQPNHVESLYERGRIHRAARRPAAAHDDFSRVLALRPDRLDARLERAEVCRTLKMWEQEASDYSLILEQSPNDWRLWGNRGMAYLKLRQWPNAINDFTKVVELRPDDHAGWADLARAHAASRGWERTVDHYSMALKLQPNNAVYLIERGHALAALERWEAASADFASAIPLTGMSANWAESWSRYALIRIHLGDRDGYRAACTDAMQRLGKAGVSEACHIVLWTCVLAPDALADGEPLLALAENEAFKNLTRNDRSRLVGAALYRAGRFEEATTRLTEAISLLPEGRVLGADSYSSFFLAMAHHRLGNVAEARRWLGKGIDTQSKASSDPIHDPGNGYWYRRVTLEILRRQVEALLADKQV